ncbi:MAG TPA: ATP-dependent RNA helicase HrpA [Acidimicrobiales bacterium]|nr:ATP-dependent RNA helicase HrpA [Acidimicrobiales bacterium]
MSAHPSAADLRERLAGLMVGDARRLRTALDRGRRPVADLAREIEAAEQRVARRRAAVPEVRYPEALPVSERKDEILAAIRDHQVVILAGETGSGKSTQVPKICLELGRGVQGVIGHTQPRRLAARTVAERVAEELGTDLGDVVGYTVRFTDRGGDRTLVRVMTDGILLAELQRDRHLGRYDTIIVDEAHERSLNIDFILGYLRQLLPRRPDLKVIVTSATIDTQKFSEHFGGAPIIEVSGRTYPVEVRYEPVVDDGDDAGRDQITAIADAVVELEAEPPGDVLVFLSGEREIRDTAQALTDLQLRDTEVLPLYARLSAAEQHRIFAPHPGRRIVLATNVAETSLTVPGIRYVVDAGTARMSRYNRRTKVQRLPIEAISQAAANQRAGRCGRVAPGVCIRLYSEEDFLSRPEYTEPEILRTNLASVILRMAAVGLGDIAAFPFVEPPDARSIKDGVALLEELGAFELATGDPSGLRRLTPMGRRLSEIPLDPRLARMVIEADRHGCAREVMVIAAALSIQDPRERPVDKRQTADELHRRFATGSSDLLAYVALWDHLREQQRALSSNQFRRLCRTEFLNYLRVREWQDIYSQVRSIAGGLGIHPAPVDEPADPDAVHQALLAGLLSHVGLRDDGRVERGGRDRREYLGAFNARFAVNPGSALFKNPPRWVMAAELVETTRLWARDVARIQPEWIERIGAHLVQRTYADPSWSRRRAGVVAVERVTLYGLPIVAGRTVDYGRIDPVVSRDLFLGHALVEGDWDTHHEFMARNAALLAEVRGLEDRVRRRDILVTDDALFDFFDARVPPDVVSGRHFDRWWKDARASEPDRLDYTLDLLVDPEGGPIDVDDFPESWTDESGVTLALTYRYAPGDEADGVTAHVPLALLNRVTAAGLDWHVPGLRSELVTALIRSLPKAVRRHFVPAPEYATRFLSASSSADGPLLEVLARALRQMTGEVVRPDDWQLERLPDHLRVSFRVEDERGRRVAFGKDLDALRRRLGVHVQAAITRAVGPSLERTGLTAWPADLDSLPRVVDAPDGGGVRAHPALVDEGAASVGVRLLATEAEQARAMWEGTRRLLVLSVPSPVGSMERVLRNATKLALAASPEPTVHDLLDECVLAALDELLAAAGGPAWDSEGFDALVAVVRGDLVERSLEVVEAVARILRRRAAISTRLDAMVAPGLLSARLDVRRHLARLVHRGFVPSTGARRLADVERYLRGLEHRLDRLPTDPARDAAWVARVAPLEDRYAELASSASPAVDRAALGRVRWMLEELRVSLFAQSVGTPGKISEERVRRALDEVMA